MNMTFKARVLPKPKIRSYNESGIGDVDIADPSKPLEVLVGPFNMSPKDKIDLYWGDNTVPVATYIHSPDAPNTDGFFSLYVPTLFIKSGTVDVHYLFTPFPGETAAESETLSVLIKLDIPGGRDPDPESPYQNEKLSRPIITPDGIITTPEGVMATLAPYENMSTGDNVILYWNGIKITVPTLTEADIGKAIQVPVSKEVIIEAGDSDRILVRYDIRDVVNNWSRFSLPTYVEVEADNSTLSAPIVLQAPDKELDLAQLAGADVQAQIIRYEGMAALDKITLVMERETAEGLPLETFIEAREIEAPRDFVLFSIPNEQFPPIAQGRARLYYRVTNASGERRSKSLLLAVIGQVQELLPPNVPVAEQNNNVLDPHEQDVIAEVPPYYFMADGNDVTLVWMGRTASGASVMHEQTINLNRDDVGTNISFLVPDDKVAPLAGGSVELYYTVTTYARALFTSPSLKLQVSGGATLLPAPGVDSVVEGTLDPADIALEAIVRIQPYTGMALGDNVVLKWDGSNEDGSYGTSTTLNTGNINKEVIFRVKKQYVDANLNGNVEVWYQVERGNRTLTSEKLPLKIGQSVVSPLPDPVVKEAKPDNTLDPVDTTNGATLSVNASANLKAGDVVTYFWKGAGGSDTKEKIISADLAGKALEVIFSSALVTANLGYTVEIAYHVKRTNGTDQPSPVLNLLVTAGLSNLEKPLVAGVVDNLLAPESVPDYGVTVTVPRYVGIAAGDSIVVKWAGAAAHATEPQRVETPAPLDFTVPKSVAVASANSAVSVTYEVTRGALTVASNANQFSVGAVGPALTIDRSELVLSARIFRHDKVPSNPPAGAFAERVASGGQPPYTYSVDHPVVNIDEASGRVVSLKSGSGVVTATDSAGNAVSYPINVSGVVRLFSAGGYNTFTQSNRAVANEGGAVPTLDAWKELRRNYGDAAHMEDGFCWASDAAGKHKRWAINANSGAAQPLRDFGFGGDSARGYGYKAD